LTAVNSGGNRDAIFNAALDETERANALVIFEGMHWADEATLDLLKYLGRRIHRTHTMLAVTYRDDFADTRVRRCVRRGGRTVREGIRPAAA